ncbi:MAG: hypothetical protein LBD55_04290 [Treponema sp.]|jgi:predicted transcriptional regulator|nr:hypothetical protein [Treponema sp.]
MSGQKKEKRRNVVSTIIPDESRKKLDDICKKLDRPKSWVIARLILEADVEKLQEPFGDND